MKKRQVFIWKVETRHSPRRSLGVMKVFLNYAEVNSRQTKRRESTGLNIATQLSSSSTSLLSLKTFFSSSLLPQIVVIRLVGFCGFEVEKEREACLCFFTGSLHRDGKTSQGRETGTERFYKRRRRRWLKLHSPSTARCDIMTDLLHMHNWWLVMSCHTLLHEVRSPRRWERENDTGVKL